MIIAKPIDDSFWLLHHDNTKVGTVVKEPQGYRVSINNVVKYYDQLDELNIVFDTNRNTERKPKFDFPTDSEPYNTLWDMQLGLPLFTKDSDSKSFYAAGWYKVNFKNEWKTVFCPKYVVLKRNEFVGPFREQP